MRVEEGETPVSRILSRRLGGGAALVGLVFATFTVTEPASAAQAAPTNLAPSGEASSNTPTLTWSRPSGAVKFEVQVDNDPGFPSPEYSTTTVNNRAVPTKLLATGDQVWRVRAFNAGGTGSSWSTESFSISPVAAPTPVSPVDGESLSQPDEPPLLTWNGTQGATSYTVEVDTEPDFLGPTYKTYTTATTSLVVPDPLSEPEYYWRVTAVKGVGVVSMPSSAVRFAVEPLQAVQLRSPEDNASTTVEDVVLDWDPVPGAQYYQLRVATDADFNTRVDDEIKVPKIYGTRYSPKVTYNNNQYYWQVRAVDLAGKPTNWTTVQNSFNRVWPDRPQAVFPAGEGTQVFPQRPYFQWTPVQHASEYQIDVGTNENFSPGTYNSCRVTGTTYAPNMFHVTNRNSSVLPDEKCKVPSHVTMYWRVRPLDRPYATPGVQGIFSPTQAFRWEPDTFSNVKPANGATVDVPTLSWEPNVAAASFKIEVFNNSGTRVVNATTKSYSYTPVISSALDPAKGPFTWYLTAVTQNTTNSVTEVRTFDLSGNVPTSSDAPLTPHSGRIGDTPTERAPSLTWEPYPGAHHYAVYAREAGASAWWVPATDESFTEKLAYPAFTDTGARLLRPGSYDWMVVAYNEANQILDTGPVTTMRIAPFQPVTGQAIAVDGGTIDAGLGCDAHLDANGVTGPRCDKVPTTPTFSWDAQPGAAFYMVYVSEDASFTNLMDADLLGTTNTKYDFTFSNDYAAFPDSQAGQAYYWHIRPCRALTACAADPVSSNGMATNAFRKESPKVVTHPVDTEVVGGQPVVTSSEVTFDWDDYFDTSQATTWPTTGELGNQSAMQYRLQVSTSNTFATLLDDVKVDQSTYTAYDRLYPDGTLYWRVQAIDGAQNGLAWSDVGTFVKQSPSAQLTYPLEGAHVAGTVPFRWGAQPFNASYRIEVYKNNDTTFSATNRLFYKDVKTTAYAWNETVPASSQPYVWRVRRFDAKGNAGAWSDVGRFYSDGAVPELLSPADESFQVGNGPLFTWTDVPGAASFVLEYKRGLTTTSVTTAATAFAPTSALRDGEYSWRVTAKDASRNVLGVSSWRQFTIDDIRPTVTAYTPRTSMRRGGNITATFSEPVRGVSSTTVRLYLGSTKVRARVTYSTSLRRATLNPSTYLRRGKTYTVKVSGAIKDARGNLVVPKSWKIRIS